MAAVVVVTLLAVGGWFAWRALRGSGGTSSAPVRVCVTPTAAPSPPVANQVTVSVLNTTDKVGLAHQVAEELKSRGFRVGHIGNVKAAVTGTAAVVYPDTQAAAARTVAEQVPSPTLLTGAVKVVTLQLGPAFRSLASTTDAAAARQRDLAASSPRPAVCSSS